MAQLAGGDPDLWTGIVGDNAPAILQALIAMEEQLRYFRERLAAGEDGVRECFADGRDWFDGEPMRALTPRDNPALTPRETGS
jgi:prephenate dehydrogenase